MRLKFLAIFTAASLLCQIVFSIYYSVSIVDQNTLINKLETAENRLAVKNQQLEIQLSKLNSLSNFLKITKQRSYIPVTSSINLN